MKATRKSGFTMIELLVVISIIGILAAVLIPMIGDAMSTSKLNELGVKGKQVVDALNQKNITGEYAGCAWPQSVADDDSDSSDGEKSQMNQKFTSTEKFFEEALLLKAKDATARRTGAMLKDITLNHLVGDGMQAATTTTIEPSNCSWSIIENYDSNNGVIPALISKNIKGDQLLKIKPADKAIDANTLLETSKPFGQSGCVIVLSSGAYRSLSSNDLSGKSIFTGSALMPDFTLSNHQSGETTLKFLQSGKSN